MLTTAVDQQQCTVAFRISLPCCHCGVCSTTAHRNASRAAHHKEMDAACVANEKALSQGCALVPAAELHLTGLLVVFAFTE